MEREETRLTDFYCGHCGAPIPDGHEFCSKCGAPLNHESRANPAESGSSSVIPQSPRQPPASELKSNEVHTVLSCAYHPDRAAKEKCERCGKLLCVECVNRFHQTHYSGHHTSYEQNRIYCSECLNITTGENAQKQAIGCIIFAVVAIIMVIVFVTVSTQMQQNFLNHMPFP